MSINTWYQCIPTDRLARLIEKTIVDPQAPGEYLSQEDETDECELDEPSLWTERNWLGLHSLLAFGKWAEQPLLGESISGGVPFGAEFSYDEPIRLMSVEKVAEIAHALAGVVREDLEATCDPDILNAARVPPEGGWRPGDFVHLWATFTSIRDFFALAAARGYAVLVHLG